MTAPEFKRVEDRAVDEAVALPGGRRARRRHRRRDAPLRVLRPPGRRARGVRQARGLVDHLPRRRGARGAAASGRSSSSKLRWRRQMSVEEFTYLRGRTAKAGQGDAAQRAAGGGLLRSGEVARRVCRRATPISPISSTSRAARSRSSARLGCEYIQIDAPQYAGAARRDDPRGLPPARQRSRPHARRVHRAGQRDHRRAIPGVTFGIHICRGNHKSMFYASGGYDRIAEQVFSRAKLRSLPARVRRRAIGDVRAAALRPRRSRRRARPGQLEDAADGSRRTT